jgi:integrase
MASIARNGKGWRAQVRVVGCKPLSKTFPKKAQAWEWAAQAERDLKAHRRGDYPKKTLQQALERFRLEEAIQHKGERWERVRTLAFERHPICQKQISAVTEDDMALWREWRLKQVSAATVRREMVLWGQVFEAAREKWRWIPKNVMAGVKKPPVKSTKPKGVPQTLIDTMVDSLGTSHKSREVALAYLLGCETAMRPWEMLGISKYQVHWRECFVHLEDTKNGDERDVPLSPGAVEVLAELDRMNPGGEFFTVTEGTLTKLWADARTRAGYGKGIHFRHSRREGIRRLSKRLPILDLARAVGHRDLNSLMIYYQEEASEMAKKLAHRTTPSQDPPPPRMRSFPEPLRRRERRVRDNLGLYPAHAVVQVTRDRGRAPPCLRVHERRVVVLVNGGHVRLLPRTTASGGLFLARL